MSPRDVLPLEARAAAGEAAFLRLLGLLFERPRPGWADEVRALAAEQAGERLRAVAEQAAAATEGEYLAVFGPGGSASPREVAYRRYADPGRMLAELSAAYRAFFFRPRAEDPVDHVAVEVGFAGYLAMKAAYTIAAGDDQGTERTREGRALFLASHLRPFAAGLGARLAGVAPAGHLADAARLLADWAGCGAADLETPVEIGACAGGAGQDAMTCGGCGDDQPAGKEEPVPPVAVAPEWRP